MTFSVSQDELKLLLAKQIFQACDDLDDDQVDDYAEVAASACDYDPSADTWIFKY